MSSVPTGLNLGPNPRRRESFSSSYKPYETAHAGADGRPIAHNVVSVSDVSEEAVAIDDDDEMDALPAPSPPRAFVRGMRSFSASYPTSAEAKKAAAADVAGPTQNMGNMSINTNAANNNNNAGNSPTVAKSPAEGGWWFEGIKDH